MQQDEIERLLPGVIQSTIQPGDLLHSLLGLMEFLHEPAEDILRNLDHFFDPYRTHDQFVVYLASWLDLDAAWRQADADPTLSPFPEELRLRELLQGATEIARWRGTAYGLNRYLTLATGIQDYRIMEQVYDSEGRLRPFHIRVIAPARARPLVERGLIARIVEAEKPAFVTCDIQVDETGEE
jgi:phage tail-like protein